jgi:broad specificity phosphatase PhoE
MFPLFRQSLPSRFFSTTTTTTTTTTIPTISTVESLSSSSSSHSVFILRHGQTDANAGGVIQGSADFSRLTDLGKAQAAASGEAFSAANHDVSIPITSLYCSPLARAQETMQVLHEQQQQQDASSASTSGILLLPNKDTTLVLDNLREIDFYDWEGRGRTELEAEFPNAWRAWENGDPDDLMVLDSSRSRSRSGSSTHTKKNAAADDLCVVLERYPLLEVWQRADQVWDEIFRLERLFNLKDDVERTTTTNNKTASLIVAHGTLGQALLGTAMGWGASNFRAHEFPNCGMVEIEWTITTSTPVMNYWTATTQEETRPSATRWRWKWPEPSTEWNTFE